MKYRLRNVSTKQLATEKDGLLYTKDNLLLIINANGNVLVQKTEPAPEWEVEICCIDCNGNGWYYVLNKLGQAEQKQCEICYGNGYHKESE